MPGLDWIGSFVYSPELDALFVSERSPHWTLIEENDLPDDYACGWLYADDNTMFVQWASIEASLGTPATRMEAEDKIAQEYKKPVREIEGETQWNDGVTVGKVSDYDIVDIRNEWPWNWAWKTSWIFLLNNQEVLMKNITANHAMLIEDWEDTTGKEFDYTNASFGLILVNDNKYVIYPEYSDDAQGYVKGVPLADEEMLRAVKTKAEAIGWPILGYIREWHSDDELQIKPISKFKTKPPKRRHIRKHEPLGFRTYIGGGGVFISEHYCPPQAPVGGQIDTTGKVAMGTIIKFVSLPDKFLVGEDTHHIYLLEAEYGTAEFPADTGAIGRAWVENDTITGIGFDFGTPTGQQLAIKQLRDWAHREGYETAMDLQHDIQGLAKAL